ncbi:fimbria/pilus periplasmic chaperone [Sphingomonas sp. HF-S4]|uniref:Fimbria/pilus periplasmic chaperone n=1 Tax=Sphingomonas agrestis TaxID=3080540 RepID=A0ABU3Y444_9SPHN|nr:fimbria/pilus periplasmic chaperone [Sphingomonas sp. HF-S4]MDV3456160.1 fimbria/pilus periplasmic chaperone [Sphingomonas sp. HF-S4]
MLALGAALPHRAAAQGLSVDPVVIALPPGKQAGTLRLRNGGDKEQVVQLRAFIWQQGVDGRDQLAPTEDVVIGPPLVRLGAGKEQVVRVLLRAPAATERAYRIVADRLPQAPRGGEVQVHLTLSLPLFAGVQRRKGPAPEWRIQADNGTRFLTLRNRGGSHLRIDSLAVRTGGGGYVEIPSNGSRYVLADGERRWPVPAAIATAPGQAVQVRVKTQGRTVETTVSHPSE